MIERDYIMRMIKQLAGVLARIIKVKEQEKYDEALQIINEAIAAQSRQDPESIAAIKSLTDKVDVANLAEKHLAMLKKVSA